MSLCNKDENMSISFKLFFGSLWLIAAYWLRNWDISRKISAYVASIVALMHVGALIGGLLHERLGVGQSVEGGVSLVGFILGGVSGALLGGYIGLVAYGNLWVYWAMQLVAVGFIIFLPLFPW